MQVLLLGGNENLTVSLSKLNCSISYSLRQLDLSYTSFSAALPNSIGCIGSLNSLDLGYCQISGVIPESIGNLTQLTELHLNGNYLLGKIPDKFSISQKISSLSLGQNLLSGKFPKSLLNLTHLEALHLSSNQLSGSIPSSIFTIPTLSVLDLSSNLFTGVGQDWFVDSNKFQNNAFNSDAPWHTTNNVSISYPDFRVLGLSSCQIKEFPEFLRNSESLEFLDLSNNMIRGKIPSWFMSKTLDQLFYLNLSHNFFTGTIDQLPVTPDLYFLRNSESLEFLDLSNNMIHGEIPSWFMSKTFDELLYSNLSHNFFTGTIDQLPVTPHLASLDVSSNSLQGPEIIGSLHSLQTLTLSHNNFSGPIPKALGNLSMLESLDLSWNRLEGTIPMQLVNLDFLDFLNLSENRLVGPIPRGRHFDTFGDDSYRGNLDLCGFPLAKDCGDTEAPPPATPWEAEQQFDDSEFFDGFTWIWLWISARISYGRSHFLNWKTKMVCTDCRRVVQPAKATEEMDPYTHLRRAVQQFT